MVRKQPVDPRWTGRPRLGMIVRLAMAVLPPAIGVAVAVVGYPYLFELTETAGALAGALAVLAAGLVSFALAVLIARRFRPYSMLLALQLAFPERAPSRLRIALRTPSPRRVPSRLEQLHAEGFPEDQQVALEMVLTYVGALTHYEHRFVGHAERSQAFSLLIAEELDIVGEDLDRFLWAVLAHDIGKITLPRDLLNKSTPLSREEWKQLQSHAERGAELLQPLEGWFQSWMTTIRHHHERWDGAGYPDSLRSREISAGARLLSVVDAFDAMTASRSYQSARTIEEAKVELEVSAGGQFDPAIVRRMLAIPDAELRNAMWPLSWMSHLPGIGARLASIAPSPVGIAGAVGLLVVAVMVAPSLTGGDAGPSGDLAFTDDTAEPVATTVPVTTTTLVPLLEGVESVTDDDVIAQMGDQAEFHVLANDGLPLNGWVEIVREPTLGSATANGSVIRYDAPNQAGLDQLWYRTCTRAACGSAKVTITVGEERSDPAVGVETLVATGAADEAILVENWVTFIELGTVASNVDSAEFFFGFEPSYFEVDPQVSEDGTLGFSTSASAPAEFDVEARFLVADLDGTHRLSEPVQVRFARLPGNEVFVP